MAKHEKKGACAACGGKGTVSYIADGKEITETCGACGGTGEA
jgi:DnaJ-class molecular chaperone